MKKKGFTLIELLAVIVILSIIALIVTPVISNIIKTVKLNALKSSAYGLMDAARLYSIQYRPEKQVRFDIVNNEIISSEENKLNYSGNAGNGVVVIEPNMKAVICLTDGVNSAYKELDDTEVVLVHDKVCDISYGTVIVNLFDSIIETDLVLDTVGDLKSNVNIASGQIVQTKGFYTISDGGGAFYEIAENLTGDDISIFALDNGLYAKLMVQHKMSVKQFGAHGDGVSDELPAFNAAISSNAESIYIPSGTYEINNNIITMSKFISLVGAGDTKTTIKNGTFQSQYGVSAMGITFDGAATIRIDYVGTHALDEDGTVVFAVTPNGPRDVIYKNCTFKNVTVASYAADNGNGTLPEGSILKNNVVENCSFKDIGKVAIYHNLTLDSGTYVNNTFTNLGNTDILRGFVNALFIGDITNNTEKEVNNLVIKNNTFENLYTKDDFEESVHIINANFIAVKADKAVIDNNIVTNLVGYGHDREGIYTKVRDLTVSNNKLTNAGLGEGHICAKPHVGETFSVILNNTFDGDAGTAIRSYSPGRIEGNVINISNVPTAITNTISASITVANNTLTIKGNTFNAGTSSTLEVNGTTVESYNKNNLINLSAVTIPVIIEDNTFSTSTNFGHYISAGNPGNIFTVRNNKD